MSSATPLLARIEALGRANAFLADALEGLQKDPKNLSPKYFYDAIGSALFEKITQLPEYYPTRTELRILSERGAAIAALIPRGSALVEFGSGSGAKIRLILRHRPDLAVYVPVDVSREFLLSEADALMASHPGLSVVPVEADFTEQFVLPTKVKGHPLVGFFPGSTIGNLDPPQAQDFLRRAATLLGPGALLIVGVDLEKDRARLEAAYDDAAGVTAQFNLNLLARMNRELGADFDLRRFRHRAFYNPALHRIEMHLVSTVAQQVRFGGTTIGFAAEETIHTENSYKYSLERFGSLAASAGWRSERVWTDEEKLFSVHALRNGEAS